MCINEVGYIYVYVYIYICICICMYVYICISGHFGTCIYVFLDIFPTKYVTVGNLPIQQPHRYSRCIFLVCINVLQCVTVCCSVLQCVAGSCSCSCREANTRHSAGLWFKVDGLGCMV